MKSSQTLPTLTKNLPPSLLNNPENLAVAVYKFGPVFAVNVFNRYYKPTTLAKAAANEQAPTLFDVSNFFSEEATLFWLRFHIAETFAFVGIYEKASIFQIRHTAELILSHEVYGQLTLPEFLSFLQKFKTAEYGKIYQSNHPNPQEFLLCLKAFWNELSSERIKIEQRRQQERMERELHNPNNMSYDEWQEIRTIERMYEMQIQRK